MATIRDVAAKAGVSVATVSRVMNNRGYLSEEIREKVRQAMRTLTTAPAKWQDPFPTNAPILLVCSFPH